MTYFSHETIRQTWTNGFWRGKTFCSHWQNYRMAYVPGAWWEPNWVLTGSFAWSQGTLPRMFRVHAIIWSNWVTSLLQCCYPALVIKGWGHASGMGCFLSEELPFTHIHWYLIHVQCTCRSRTFLFTVCTECRWELWENFGSQPQSLVIMY